jgi:hypothetical protein
MADEPPAALFHFIFWRLLMRRCTTTGLLLLFVGAMIALAGEPSITPDTRNNTVLPANGIKQPTPARHLDEVIYYEDWESGLNGWISRDLTATPGTWHIDTWNAFGGTGMSWCMGQHPVYCDTVGYDNDWYMVLDSPPITLPAEACTLSFYSRVACENPAGATAPYNGWDGCNLRISTDQGNTWTVITNANLDPDYDKSSLYSFGFQHGEGPNVPGWVYQHLTWFKQKAFLGQWAGQTVKLRWAFASDPAWCTCDGSGQQWAFGWQVDNFRIFHGSDTTWFHNGDDTTGWRSESNQPVGGDLWRIADCNHPAPPPCPPPSGTHYLVCNNPTGRLYNNDMNNEILSPYIDLRSLDFGTAYVDFQVAGALGSPCTNFPEDCDYWHWEVTPDSGTTWWFASNPCGGGLGNYVHPDAPDDWFLYSEAYNSGFDMSCYIGSVVRLKVVFESDEEITGVGICYDDITLTYQSGYTYDMTCYTLQVRFPTMEGRAARGIAYFKNNGSEDNSAGVPAWWKMQGGTALRFLPNLLLASGQEETRAFSWTPASTGDKTVLAWTAMSEDEDFSNDTSSCENINVRAAAASLELGYDNRTTQYRFNYETGDGAMCRFTPGMDSIGLPYDLDAIRLQFDEGQIGAKDIGLRVYEDQSGAPGNLLYSTTVTVTPPADVIPNWKEVSLAGVPGTENMTSDFWVWLEVTNTEADQRYPQILGDDAEPWNDHEHFYTYQGSGNPGLQPYFYQIRALVTSHVAADVKEFSPMEYDLDQNYPNPFNPVTEIRYSIPRTEKVSLRVFNLLGEEVASLVDGTQSVGTHRVQFDGSKLPSGVYVYKLQTDGYTASKKMVLLK